MLVDWTCGISAGVRTRISIGSKIETIYLGCLFVMSLCVCSYLCPARVLCPTER